MVVLVSTMLLTNPAAFVEPGNAAAVKIAVFPDGVPPLQLAASDQFMSGPAPDQVTLAARTSWLEARANGTARRLNNRDRIRGSSEVDFIIRLGR